MVREDEGASVLTRFQCHAGREPRLRPWEHGFYNAGHLRSNFLYGIKSRMTDPLALRVVRRFAGMTAEAFAEAFFHRHPNLKRYAPKRIVDKSAGGGGSHPEARQAGNEIHLYPKFWLLDDKTRDFVFAHEIGHYTLAEYGLSRMIADLGKQGIDPWDSSSLPYGQGNMDEAFADCFAAYFFEHSELKRRYPQWEEIVRAVT